MEPLISIIVPVYNSESYLPRCIESLLCQTYQSIEIILVNDGSSDRSGEICDSYASEDLRIKVIHKANGGVSAARNDGIAASSGEYLMFCDSDDEYMPQMAKKLFDSVTKNGSDIALCGFKKQQEGREYDVPMQTECYCDGDIAKKLVMPMCVWGYAPKGCVAFPIYGSVCRGIYKKELIRDQGIGFPPELGLGEDMIFNINAFLGSSRISALEECLYCYYEVPTSATHKKGGIMWKKYVSLWERTHADLEKHGTTQADLEWHNFQLSRYGVSAIVEGICPRSISKKEKKREVKAILSHPLMKKTLKELPKELSKKDKILCLMLRPAFSGIVLWYYQRKI